MEKTKFEWISTNVEKPPTNEPVVYLRPTEDNGKYNVGIAYWTVSNKWNPEMESMHAVEGFTHWLPLPDPPAQENKK